MNDYATGSLQVQVTASIGLEEAAAVVGEHHPDRHYLLITLPDGEGDDLLFTTYTSVDDDDAPGVIALTANLVHQVMIKPDAWLTIDGPQE